MSSRYTRFFPSTALGSGSYFLGAPARSALTWVIVSQNSFSTFSSTGRPPPPSARPRFRGAPPLASGRASPVHHSWRLSKSSKRSPSSGMPQLSAPLTHRHPRPPLRPPVRAVVGPPVGHRSHIPPPGQAQQGQCRCSPARTHMPGRGRGRPAQRGRVSPLPAVTTYTVTIAASRIRQGGP
jgi:hypothetical protein